jgi:hypothetical protein
MGAHTMPPFDSPPPESALLLPYYFAARMGMPQDAQYELLYGARSRESHYMRALIVATVLHDRCIRPIIGAAGRGLEMPD